MLCIFYQCTCNIRGAFKKFPDVKKEDKLSKFICLNLFKALSSIVYTLLHVLKPLLEHVCPLWLWYGFNVLQKCLHCKIKGIKPHPTELLLNEREDKEVAGGQIRTVRGMFHLLDPFHMQKFLSSSCPVCSSIVMMQEQAMMPCSWLSFSNCSKHKRQTFLYIPCSSHCALGNKQYCCHMASTRDKNSNHLLSNGATSNEFLRGSLSNGIHC